MFGRKQSVEDVIKAFNSLTDEDKAKFLDETQEAVAKTDEKVATAEEEQAEGNENGQEEQAEQAEEQQAASGEGTGEETQETEERAGEGAEVESNEAAAQQVEMTKEAQDEKKEIDNAQMARIEALEGEISALKERLETVINNLENKDFGMSPKAPEGGGQDDDRYSAVMRGYAGANAKRYN